jgi:hypothetical protein
MKILQYLQDLKKDIEVVKYNYYLNIDLIFLFNIYK